MKFKAWFAVPIIAVALSAVYAEEEAVSTEKMQLTADIKIGTGLEKYDPTGVADSFPASVSQLVGWSQIKGASAPIVVKHVWILNGEEKAVVELPVKSATYRTWSRKTIEGLTGKWRLEVRGPDESVIGSKDFEVTAEASPANAAPVNAAPANAAPAEGAPQK